MGKETDPGDEKVKVKQRTVNIHSDKDEKEMEEGKQSAKAFMPNLPKPLTIEEKKYLLAVERGDISTVRKMLQKSHRHTDYMDKDCVDPLGRGALHMAIDNENLEMVELLVVMGVETKDALLHSIDVEFVEAVEVLLEHEEVIHKEGEPYSWEKVDRQTASFTPEITPLILAAHRDNYEILKILLDRGAMLPMPHDIRCGCPECIQSSSEDSLRHSMSRINSYRALASPSLIALSSTDPILTAFELSWELKNLAYSEQEFRSEYLELRRQCRNFAEQLLSHTRSSTELAVILNYDPESPPYEDGEHMKLQRLELAVEYKQKKFVAHPNVQQLLAALWYEGLPGFRRKGVHERLIEIIKVAVFFPFYCMHYMIMPESPRGKLMRTPFMKFLIHSSSYLFFLLLLILVSVRFEDLVIYIFGTENMRKNLEESSRRQRGNLPTPTECCVCLYVFGFILEEIQEIRQNGIQKYLKNMWNILDVMRDTLYISTLILRIGAFVQQSIEITNDPLTAYIPKEEWATFDPQLVSEGLFSAANVFSALKLVHIFSINPYLGPLQISLGRMVIDIVKFFFIYTLVLFAFACGLTQLLWYYNDLEKQKCYSLPGGLPDWTKQGDACMKWRRFHNLFESSQSLFWAGFGMVGLSDFELTGIREYTRFWSMLMFGTYSVINIIVLLNLLIAMMSSSYSFIVEHADTEWKFARTKLWMSYFEEGKTLPPPFNIFPNVKLFRKFFGGSDNQDRKLKRMSTRTQRIKRKARDYRYLGVMRALIWRYVCSLQTRDLENPVTEDDINEVKGDISSLRFELIDLFGSNGMDVSSCAKKSKAALGRKMRIWERRLMRDFHVSPAMGAEETPAQQEEPQEPAKDSKAADRFRRIAKLAMTPKVADIASAVTGKNMASQIGRTNLHDDTGRENLKKAMEKARRKMEEGTPDGTPNSSRGCSPYPDLYTGPHLLDAIMSLDLSPMTSSANTPNPDFTLKAKRDALAKDPNLLTIPGRRSERPLDKNIQNGTSINVPPDVFSVGAFKAISALKTDDKNDATKDENKEKKEKKAEPARKQQPPPPATISTVSEVNSIHPKKENDKTQTKATEEKNLIKDGVPGPKKESNSLTSDEIRVTKNLDDILNASMSQGKRESAKDQPPQRLHLGEKDAAVLKSGEIMQPSLVKIGEYNPPPNPTNIGKKDASKPTALRIEPKFGQGGGEPSAPIARARPQANNNPPMPAKPQQATQMPQPILRPINQPPEQVEIQNTDIVRKPRMPVRQGSRERVLEDNIPDTKPVKAQPPVKSTPMISSVMKEQSKPAKEEPPRPVIPPAISVIPSTPAGADTPPVKKKQMVPLTKQDVHDPPPKYEEKPRKEAPPIPKAVSKEPSRKDDKPQPKPKTSNDAPVEVRKPNPPQATESSKVAVDAKPEDKEKKNQNQQVKKDKEEPAANKDTKEDKPTSATKTQPTTTDQKTDKPKELSKNNRTESIEASGVTPTQSKKGGWL